MCEELDQVKDDLVPLALEYYLGVIESHEEDDDDDDSEGAGANSDSDEGDKKKKAGKKGGAKGDQECKQQ